MFDNVQHVHSVHSNRRAVRGHSRFVIAQNPIAVGGLQGKALDHSTGTRAWDPVRGGCVTTQALSLSREKLLSQL
jgi:hypothetical protein